MGSAGRQQALRILASLSFKRSSRLKLPQRWPPSSTNLDHLRPLCPILEGPPGKKGKRLLRILVPKFRISLRKWSKSERRRRARVLSLLLRVKLPLGNKQAPRTPTAEVLLRLPTDHLLRLQIPLGLTCQEVLRTPADNRLHPLLVKSRQLRKQRFRQARKCLPTKPHFPRPLPVREPSPLSRLDSWPQGSTNVPRRLKGPFLRTLSPKQRPRLEHPMRSLPRRPLNRLSMSTLLLLLSRRATRAIRMWPYLLELPWENPDCFMKLRLVGP